MLIEVANSLFITFIASEYLLASKNKTVHDIRNVDDNEINPYYNRNSRTGGRIIKIAREIAATFFSSHSRPTQYSFIAVFLINLFVHFHNTGVALARWIHSKVEGGFYIPRICLAIISFSVALYYDCRRVALTSSRENSNRSCGTSAEKWSNEFFFRLLFNCFCRLLPIYPFLAVIISFGFLFVATLFEKMHLPTRILNMPIYYGTLYGPLSFMYWDIKKGIVDYLIRGRRRLLVDEKNPSYLPR